MITYLIVVAVIQFVAGFIGLWSFSYDFQHDRKKYESAKVDRYNENYPAETYAKRMKKDSAWAKMFGLGLATSPFAGVIVPLAVVGSVIYGVKYVVTYFLPAINYSHKD